MMVVYKAYYNGVSLISWDLSAIPKGAAITSATMSLYTTLAEWISGGGGYSRLYRLRRPDWEELQATWRIYKTGSNWGAAGAAHTSTDIDTTLSSQFLRIPAPAWYEWDVKDLVQDAVDNRDGRLHLHINHAEKKGGNEIVAKNHPTVAQRPKIAIAYTLPLPAVMLSPATNLDVDAARLSGDVTGLGEADDVTVTLFWGKTDGGTNPANWDNSGEPTSPAQPQGVASFYKDVTGLDAETLYYFRACVKDDEREEPVWAESSLTFTTLTPVGPGPDIGPALADIGLTIDQVLAMPVAFDCGMSLQEAFVGVFLGAGILRPYEAGSKLVTGIQFTRESKLVPYDGGSRLVLDGG